MDYCALDWRVVKWHHLMVQCTCSKHIPSSATECQWDWGFYHPRRLRQIRWRVGWEVATRLVVPLVMSRLDYCNLMLAGLPQTTSSPLQRVQNAAAHLIFELGTREHVTARFNFAVSCTQSSMGSAQAIWTTPRITLTAVVLVAVCDLRRRQTSHKFGEPVCAEHHIRGTYMLSLVLGCSENNFKHTF